MNTGFLTGFLIPINLFIFYKVLRTVVSDKLAFQRGYKQGYGEGLNHGGVAYKMLVETEDTLTVKCYVPTRTHFPKGS